MLKYAKVSNHLNVYAIFYHFFHLEIHNFLFYHIFLCCYTIWPLQSFILIRPSRDSNPVKWYLWVNKWKDYLYLSEHKLFFWIGRRRKTILEGFVRYTLIIISNHTCRIFDLVFMRLRPAFLFLNPFTRVIISLHLLFSPFNLCKQTDSPKVP